MRFGNGMPTHTYPGSIWRDPTCREICLEAAKMTRISEMIHGLEEFCERALLQKDAEDIKQSVFDLTHLSDMIFLELSQEPVYRKLIYKKVWTILLRASQGGINVYPNYKYIGPMRVFAGVCTRYEDRPADIWAENIDLNSIISSEAYDMEPFCEDWEFVQAKEIAQLYAKRLGSYADRIDYSPLR